MKWLWNDYEMTMKWLWIRLRIWYEMNYETTYEIMICIDYELSASSMKKYELCMKKYFSTILLYENVWKSSFQQAYYMKMYESSENCLVWGVHLSRT